MVIATKWQYIELFIRVLVAFLIPLSWGLILYPWMRKAEKSWRVFFVAIIMLSLLTLSFFINKRITAHAHLGVTAYILGVLFGIAALSFLFTLKSRWLEALPKKGTLFSPGIIKKRVHLRNLIQLAVLLEEEGVAFYNKLADTAKDENSKSL